MTNKNAYAKSGVDVEAGYEVVERIKKHVARTERAGVMGALGGFGGMFDLSKTGVNKAYAGYQVRQARYYWARLCGHVCQRYHCCRGRASLLP